MWTRSTAEIPRTRTRAHCPWRQIPRWFRAQSSVQAKNLHENTHKMLCYFT
jgi:hypothetical protein